MSVVAVGWLFFRADSMEHAMRLISAAVRHSDPVWAGSHIRSVLMGLALVAGCDLFLRSFAWDRVSRWSPGARALLQGVLLACIVARWGRETPNFIYFQF